MSAPSPCASSVGCEVVAAGGCRFRAAGKVLGGKSDIPTRLWIAPSTRMDALILTEEGYYSVLGRAGARMEMPGRSLCMGNQA